MATRFLQWLDLPSASSWLEIGCGTGALTEAILREKNPSPLIAIDPSKEFINAARKRIRDNAVLRVASANDLPLQDSSVDIVVSGLAINFFPDIEVALTEMIRVSKPNGVVAAYVWDYAGRMDMLRYFWDAVTSMDPDSSNLDEGVRFPICNIDNLKTAFQEAGLSEIDTSLLDIQMVFKNFEDYWRPFFGGQGPAPGYLGSLSTDAQEELRKVIRNQLPVESNGSIRLLGRAIGIRGINRK